MDRTTKPNIQSGYWFFTVTNTNAVTKLRFRIGAMMFEDSEKLFQNPSLFGAWETKEGAADEEMV